MQKTNFDCFLNCFKCFVKCYFLRLTKTNTGIPVSEVICTYFISVSLLRRDTQICSDVMNEFNKIYIFSCLNDFKI